MQDYKGQAKVASKESSKRQNKLSWERYKTALDGFLGKVTKTGIRINAGVIFTYEQKTKETARQHPHGADRISLKRLLLGVGRHDKQLLVHEATFGAIAQKYKIGSLEPFIHLVLFFFNVEHF